jgi:cytosine/creatinine deaminase
MTMSSGFAAPNAGVMPGARSSLLLSGVTLAAGQVVDVRLHGGSIAEVGAPGTLPAADEHLDLGGYLLLPAPAEPHAHLDKALTAASVPNPTGDLLGAVEAWVPYRSSMSHEDVVRRATEAALLYLANGATAVRSHVDVAASSGLRALEALLELREALREQLTLQLVAFATVPLTGAAGAENRALLRAAMESGADVVGSCPYLDADPAACQEICLSMAAEFQRPIDLHTDETIDPAVLHLSYFADLVAKTRFPYGATASHCVSLGVQPSEVAAKVAERVAAAGIAVICLPQTNLFLQARDHLSAPPRGLTALRALLAAGATVAAGGDNLQDPFNSVGSGDPLDTASLLVLAGHLSPEEAFTAVSFGARTAMGLPSVRLEAGFPAELLAVRASSLREAVAVASHERVVIHNGCVVSRTSMTREFPHRRAPRSPPGVFARTQPSG